MRTRKYKKPRIPHKVFLVICEGETEEEYINLLKRLYRVPVSIKTRVSGNTINERLVNQYARELGLGKEDDYSVFYVYDSDIECIVDKIRKLTGTMILSNPCFELWYLLHVQDANKAFDSTSLHKILTKCHPTWKTYTKGRLSAEQVNMLISAKDEAIDRAKNLKWPANPSTNIHEFIEALEREKTEAS